MKQRELERLAADESRRLLDRGRVGRLVYVDREGPAAVPVNYVVVDDCVVIRIEGGSKREVSQQDVVGFEVDEIDGDGHTGWSVLVRGAAEEVPMEDVSALLQRSGGRMPEPWAYGFHHVWLRVPIRTISGRRLGAVREHLVY